MKTIAVIDDDVYIGNLLQEALQKEGYGVLRAYSGTEALLLLSERKPDLVLLDLMLPGLSGEEVLPKIKEYPVIILSAKTDVGDKVAMLSGGACDYVTKPFELRELLARIAVQLRAQKVGGESELVWRDLALNPVLHTVTVGETPVRLTKTELAILNLLMSNPNRIIAKSVLLDRIENVAPDCMESSLKVHVSNLRRKLREGGAMCNIEAVWGIGFRLTE